VERGVIDHGRHDGVVELDDNRRTDVDADTASCRHNAQQNDLIRYGGRVFGACRESCQCDDSDSEYRYPAATLPHFAPPALWCWRHAPTRGERADTCPEGVVAYLRTS
jgi:hypothetical protein